MGQTRQSKRIYQMVGHHLIECIAMESNQTRCAKQKQTAHLLNTSDVLGDVFNADGVLYSQSV